jgi:hypothetical protein
VKTLASVILIGIATTVIGLLCLAGWTHIIDTLLPGFFPDVTSGPDITSANAHGWILRFGAGIVPSWIPAAFAFRWLWSRLVHQALSLKMTSVIYFVCVVSIPGLFYLFWSGFITHEEAIALYVAAFLLTAFVIFRTLRSA